MQKAFLACRPYKNRGWGLDLATICWPDRPIDQIVAAPGTESISPEKVCRAPVCREQGGRGHVPLGAS